MEELSLHILDIVENSINAGADRITIKIIINQREDLLTLEIKDNGQGMDAVTAQRAIDPFFTTKPRRKTGLGLPLLAQAAAASGGKVIIQSQPQKGTTVTATFQYSHIDRQPLGNIEETILTLVISHPEIHFIYQYKDNAQDIYLDTEEIKTQFAPYPLDSPQSIQRLHNILSLNKGNIKG